VTDGKPPAIELPAFRFVKFLTPQSISGQSFDTWNAATHKGKIACWQTGKNDPWFWMAPIHLGTVVMKQAIRIPITNVHSIAPMDPRSVPTPPACFGLPDYGASEAEG
jgi:hypothetical protein